MKQHAKKIIALVIALVAIIVGICIGVSSCNGNNPAGGSSSGSAGSSGSGNVSVDADGKATYTVELDSAGGMAMENVGVYVYTDSSLSELVWFDQTDEFGMMSFTDVPSDDYVAVLQDVPVGYAVEDYYPLTGEVTKITLCGSLIPYEEAGEFTYEPGAMVYDFTVTDPQGVSYTLSELLQEKKCIVLNFWYSTCAPCKSEFPAIQAAYEKYSDDVIVLAMNPVDGDNESIKALMEELGLTFPMTVCGEEWQKMVDITAYPTTVVIDRYGMISLMHTGAVTNPEVWETIFAHYTSDEYEQAIYENISLIAEGLDLEGELTEGTEDNPIQTGGGETMEVDVAAGSVTYLDIYKLNRVYVTIYDPDAYIIYNGNTYKASGGKVSVWLTTDDTFSGIKLGIGNSGSEDKTFTLHFTAKAGSYGNPYSLTLGEFTTNIEAGNDQGIYYTWVAPESGVLSLENVSCTGGVRFGYVLYNLNSCVYNNTEGVSGNASVSVEVQKGQKVQVIISTLPDEGHNYPAATITSFASFTAGEVAVPHPYTITVVGDDGVPVAGVELMVNGLNYTTDENGVVTAELKNREEPYAVTVMPVSGYEDVSEKISIQVVGDSEVDKTTITLKKLYKYVVNVVDQSNMPVAGATVTVGGKQVVTNEEGVASFRIVSGDYAVKVTAPAGYNDISGITFKADRTATVKLSPATVPYTVTVKDANGAAIAGATVTVPQQEGTLANGSKVTIPAITVTTNANGVATYKTYLAEHTLSVAYSGYFGDTYTMAAEEQALGVTMYKTATYTVNVCSTMGEVVEGVTVFATETSGKTNATFSCTTDANGKASFQAPEGGTYVACVDVANLPDGYAYDSTELAFVNGNVDITLMNGYVFSVQVLDQDGNPVPNVKVDFNGALIEEVETEVPDEPTVDEPTIDEPTIDEPTIDEPTTDEPTTDEPTTDESTTDESATGEPAADESTTGEPAADDTAAAGEAASDAAAVTEPAAESAEATPAVTAEETTEPEVTVVKTEVKSTATTDKDGMAYFVADEGYNATITLPDGYRLADTGLTKSFGEGYGVSFKLQSVTTYSLTLKDYAGNVLTGTDIYALLTNGGNQVTAKFTNGVYSALLDTAEYAVSMMYDSSKYYIDGGLTLSSKKTSATVYVAQQLSGETEYYYHVQGEVPVVTEGSFYMKVKPGETNYFVIDLAEYGGEQGYYSFQFFGNGQNAVYNCGNAYYYANDKQSTNDEGVCTLALYGMANFFGIEADDNTTEGVLVVTYVGEIKEITKIDYDDPAYSPIENYSLSGTVTTFTKEQMLNNTYGNPLNGDSSSFVEENGYIYYKDENGKKHLVLIDFDWESISLTNLLANGPLLRYYDTDGDGEWNYREDYTNCMQAYVDNADGGYHPLNMELLYMLCNSGEHKGWWDPDSMTKSYENYFSASASPENAWMCFLAYVE